MCAYTIAQKYVEIAYFRIFTSQRNLVGKLQDPFRISSSNQRFTERDKM